MKIATVGLRAEGEAFDHAPAGGLPQELVDARLSEDACWIVVEASSCMVMIAQVHLSIPELRLHKNALVGRYSIRVPLRSSKNDTGSIQLALDKPLAWYMEHGGEIYGRGYSDQEGYPPRTIVARVIPQDESIRDGVLELEIGTGNRDLFFETTYEVKGEFPPAPQPTVVDNRG